MRHRSISTFLILVASLVAIPQASQQLLSFKSAVGECLRTKISSAFLSMHAQARESGIIPARARTSSDPAEMAKAGAAAQGRRAKKSAGAARADVAREPADLSAAPHAFEHLAMLDDPAHAIPVAKLDLDFEDVPFAPDAVEHLSLRLQRGFPARRVETVMIVPPGDDIPLPRVAAERDGARAPRGVAHGLQLEELRKNAAYIASQLREGKLETKWADVEMRRHIDALVREGEKFGGAGAGSQPKAFRVKKVAMPAAPACRPACPTRPAAVIAAGRRAAPAAPPVPLAGE